MTARAGALVAALVLVACSGSSKVHGTNRSASGGSAGLGGAGSAGLGGAGTSGAGEPLLLASGQLGPVALAVDAENVYWLNLGSFTSGLKDKFPNGDASIMKCARTGCGGHPTALVTNRTFADQASLPLAVDGGYVYWNDSLDSSESSFIVRCAVGGCGMAPEPVISRPAYALTASADRLYATQFQAEVFTCGAAECESSVTDLWAAGYTPIATDIAVDATAAYWTTVSPDNVLTCPLTGCANTPSVVMPSNSGLVSIMELAMDAENVYLADSNSCSTGAVAKCKKTGCADGPTRLASKLEAPSNIVTDGVHVYFTEQANAQCGTEEASVRRCGVNGCDDAPETLALDVTVPSALAVDAEYVFVADSGTGEVWRLAKPAAR